MFHSKVNDDRRSDVSVAGHPHEKFHLHTASAFRIFTVAALIATSVAELSHVPMDWPEQLLIAVAAGVIATLAAKLAERFI